MYSCFYQHGKEVGKPSHESQLREDIFSRRAPGPNVEGETTSRKHAAPPRPPAPPAGFALSYSVSKHASTALSSVRKAGASVTPPGGPPIPQDGGAQLFLRSGQPFASHSGWCPSPRGASLREVTGECKVGVWCQAVPPPLPGSPPPPPLGLPSLPRHGQTYQDQKQEAQRVPEGAARRPLPWGLSITSRGPQLPVRRPFSRKPHRPLTCLSTSQQRTRRGCQKTSGSRSLHWRSREEPAAELYWHVVLRRPGVPLSFLKPGWFSSKPTHIRIVVSPRHTYRWTQSNGAYFKTHTTCMHTHVHVRAQCIPT